MSWMVIPHVEMADNVSWLPTYAPMAEPFQHQAQRVDFPGDRSVLLQPTSAEELPTVPNDVQFAVVLDRSRSMAAVRDEVCRDTHPIARICHRQQSALIST